MFSELRRPSAHLPPLLAVGAFSNPHGPPHCGPSARKHFLQDNIKQPKRQLQKVPVPTSRRLLACFLPQALLSELHTDTATAHHGGSPPSTGAVLLSRPTCHEMASRHLDLSVGSSYCKSHVFGPRAAFRTPDPFACYRPLLNSLCTPHLGPSARKHFLQDKTNCRRGCYKKCRCPCRAACWPGLFLRLCLASSTQPPPPPTTGDLLRARAP